MNSSNSISLTEITQETEETKAPLILVVDDELRMRRVLVDYLEIKGYRTEEASDGVEALEKYKEVNPDLILLDVMMPRMDGWQVCKAIQAHSRTPIIMLTAKGEEGDELQGFSLGADEYIRKPFSLKILAARIEVILRRIGKSTVGDDPSKNSDVIPGVSINYEGREVRANGELVELTYTEFELLTYFVDNKGIALSRDKILDSVWQYDYYGDARTIDTHVKKLRNKLGDHGDVIKTIRGIGYKLNI